MNHFNINAKVYTLKDLHGCMLQTHVFKVETALCFSMLLLAEGVIVMYAVALLLLLTLLAHLKRAWKSPGSAAEV